MRLNQLGKMPTLWVSQQHLQLKNMICLLLFQVQVLEHLRLLAEKAQSEGAKLSY